MVSQAVNCYAIRRVNPFMGVWQVLKTEAGRAISSDGNNWDIEIRAEQRAGWGSLNQNRKSHAYLRYAHWSEQTGLKTNPLPPGLGPEEIRQAADELVSRLKAVADALPFPLTDRKELWLLDQDEQLPLALLASVEVDNTSRITEPRAWSASMNGYGSTAQRRFNAAKEIEEIVRKRAGFNLRKQWVTRREDGTAIIDNGNTEPLPAEIFPPYLLRQDWPDSAHESLVDEYISWTAPALLTLQQLDNQQRYFLEQRLQTSASSVDHHWQLYPEMIDENLIRTARVQGHIQSSHVQQEQPL